VGTGPEERKKGKQGPQNSLPAREVNAIRARERVHCITKISRYYYYFTPQTRIYRNVGTEMHRHHSTKLVGREL